MLDLHHCIQYFDDLREIQDRNGAVPRSDDSRHVMRREGLSATLVGHPAELDRAKVGALPRYPATFFVPDESFSRGIRKVNDRSLNGCYLVYI
jgi:hypothetical protein